jgi:hypothetical protein
MSSLIYVLPIELVLHILTFIHHNDLAVVARLSRHFQGIVEPVLWTKIEFHSPLFHEHYVHKQLREEQVALQRPYHQYVGEESDTKSDNLAYGGYLKDEDYHYEVRTFLRVIQNKHGGDQKRIDHLAGRVRWLCLPVNGMFANWRKESDPWNALAVLKNLEYLEVSAIWKPLDEVVPFAGSSHTLLRLSTLKLRGYIPAEFVGYLLRSASTITNLEMGLIDAPLGCMALLSPTPTNSEDSEDMAEDDALDIVDNLPSSSLVQPEGIENIEGIVGSVLGEHTSPDGEVVAPRSLPCLDPSSISQFTSLTRLYLCRPSEAEDQREIMTLLREIFTFVRTDQIILQEWASLLCTAKNTIAHLTFDQRPVGDENEDRGIANDEFMFSYANGPGYHRFVEHVLPVLLEDGEWPALKSIQLFGFEWDGRKVEDDWYMERSGESVEIHKQLQRRFPNVAVSSALGRRMLFKDETGEIDSGGDVLDSSGSFSDDEHEQGTSH